MTTKRKQLTEFQRGEIIGAWKFGHSESQIGEKLNCPKSTVNKVIAAYKKGIEVPPARTGRPPKITERDNCHLMQVLNKDRRVNINELCEDFVASTSTSVS